MKTNLKDKKGKLSSVEMLLAQKRAKHLTRVVKLLEQESTHEEIINTLNELATLEAGLLIINKYFKEKQ